PANPLDRHFPSSRLTASRASVCLCLCSTTCFVCVTKLELHLNRVPLFPNTTPLTRSHGQHSLHQCSAPCVDANWNAAKSSHKRVRCSVCLIKLLIWLEQRTCSKTMRRPVCAMMAIDHLGQLTS